MAKNQPATFSAAPDKVAALQGIDWTKLDWTKVAAIIQMLVSLFAGGGPVTPATIKAAYPNCPDACCKLCCEAMDLALQSAAKSAQCCLDCNTP